MRWEFSVFVVFCSISLFACASAPPAGNISPAPQVDHLDKQKAELQSCLGGYDETQVERRQCALFITMGCDSLFESNSDRINPAGSKEIDAVAEVVKNYPDTKINIGVHTDCVRSEEENLALSELRAWVVKKAMIEKGVQGCRVTARGWGESKPIGSNATDEGRKANRRVTITLEQG